MRHRACTQRGFVGGRCPAQSFLATPQSALAHFVSSGPTYASPTVTNFGFADFGAIAAFTAISLPVGYSAGTYQCVLRSAFIALSFALLRRPLWFLPLNPHPPFAAASPLVRGRSVGAAVAIGSLAGFLWAYQGSAGRLMGAFENHAEVAAAQKRR